MKTIINLLLIVVTLILFSACKKDGFSTVPLSSLKIGNYITGGTAAKLRGVYSSSISNNSNLNYGILPGSQELYIYPLADSLRPYYHVNHKEVLAEGQSYSLFLGGTPSDVKSVFIAEAWPKSDSNVRVRILNFSPGSPSVNITLSTSTSVMEFSNVNFGQLTSFKPYTKTGNAPAYTFQVRNSLTNAVIASHTLSSALVAGYNNFTLVLRGVVGGSPAAAVSRVLHN